MFAGSPVRRTGHVRFLRNVLIAAGNSGDCGLAPLIVTYLGHADPLVRGMAVWALSKLAPINKLRAMAADYIEHETDNAVATEWAEVLKDSNQ